jgi:hypothetical protein
MAAAGPPAAPAAALLLLAPGLRRHAWRRLVEQGILRRNRALQIVVVEVL